MVSALYFCRPIPWKVRMSSKVVPFKGEKKPPARGSVLKYIGLLIVGLAVVGLVFSSLFTGISGFGSGEWVFGRYGNKDIAYTYNNSFGLAVSNRMAEQDANNDQNGQLFGFIRRMVWQEEFSNAAVRTAIAYHLEESGYAPSSRAIDLQVIQSESFQSNGRFDENKYRETSAALKAAYRDSFREYIALNTWSEDALDSLYRSDAQLEFLDEMRATLRTYDYIALPFSGYPAEEVLEYARENAELFRILPVSRITVEDERIAEEVVGLFNERREEIDAFAALAQEYSTDSYKEEGGSMGPTAYHSLLETMSAEEVDTVFALASGEIAGPYNTEYGWVVFHADGNPTEVDFEAAVDDVRGYMLQNEVGMIEDSLLAKAAKLREAAVSSESFRDAMEAEGFEVSTTVPFPFNYGGDSLLGDSPEKTGDTLLSGTTSSEGFWSGIAPLEGLGEISQPIVLSEAIGLFSLASTETQEKSEYWNEAVSAQTNNSIAEEFQKIVLSEDSKYFVDRFSETYDKIFEEQG